MAKVTSKLQVTIPKVLADRYQIRPGDEIRFEAAGDVIRVIPPSTGTPTAGLQLSERLGLFDAATERQRERQIGMPRPRPRTRGWTRQALYRHGLSD